MPDSQLYTDEAAVRKATLLITSLATSKLRLFKAGTVLNRFTTRAALIAAECDFSGYTAGGYTLTAWTGPTKDPSGGAIMTSPLVNPAFTTPGEGDPVANEVGGWWVDDGTSKIRVAGQYDPPRTLGADGDGFPVVVQIVEARNPVAPIE